MRLHRIFQNKLIVTLIVILLIVGLIVLLARLSTPKPEISTPTPPLEKITALTVEEAKNNIVIIEANSLYEIGAGEPIITAVINDKTPLLAKFPFLNRAYKNDLIITTPKKTVIYSPSTKSIRDISTVSMYEELRNMIDNGKQIFNYE